MSMELCVEPDVGPHHLSTTMASADPSSPRVRTRRRSYSSLLQYHLCQIPIVIPTFENPSYTRGMIAQLRKRNLDNIIVIDNRSSSSAMLDLLDELRSEVVVIDLPENRGPRHIIECEESYAFLPELFCVTDPDLQFNSDMPVDFLKQMLFASHRLQAGKVGLALELADRADFRPMTVTMHGREYTVAEWENQFWTTCVGAIEGGSPIFKADIDTTFALYNKKYFHRDRFYEGYRVAGVYACRHLPWYKDNGLPREEQALYAQRQRHSYYVRAT